MWLRHSHKNREQATSGQKRAFCITIKTTLSSLIWYQNQFHTPPTLWDMTTCVGNLQQFVWKCDSEKLAFTVSYSKQHNQKEKKNQKNARFCGKMFDHQPKNTRRYNRRYIKECKVLGVRHVHIIQTCTHNSTLYISPQNASTYTYIQKQNRNDLFLQIIIIIIIIIDECYLYRTLVKSFVKLQWMILFNKAFHTPSSRNKIIKFHTVILTTSNQDPFPKSIIQNMHVHIKRPSLICDHIDKNTRGMSTIKDVPASVHPRSTWLMVKQAASKKLFLSMVYIYQIQLEGLLIMLDILKNLSSDKQDMLRLCN